MKELRSFSKSLISFHFPSIILLHEKCPNMKFSLVHIFLCSVQLQKNTDQKNSVFGHFSRSILPSLILTHFYIEKVVWFTFNTQWLISISNKKLGWNKLKNLFPNQTKETFNNMEFYVVRIFPYMDPIREFLHFAYCILLFIWSKENQKLIFHLIKSIAATQTRICRFRWLSYCTLCTDTTNIDVHVANQIADILVAIW